HGPLTGIGENRLFYEVVRLEPADCLMRRCLQLGPQTRQGEWQLAAMAEALAE
ncbi:MAG: hypothetical protein IID61_13610, partial [SAR324 cluster bacterium]|nr:hypothetical protein [SAR324 cluster bacterium]